MSAFSKYPMFRGIASYALLWPASNLIQQTISGKTIENYDWKQCARYGLFGSCFIAPALFNWIKFTSWLFPGNTFRTAVTKAVVEQLTYGPTAMASFYFGMSLLEGNTVDESVEEVKVKFWPTFKAAVCVWPALQTINFYWVPERNRVVFVSIGSVMWTCFLAYMKNRDKESFRKQKMDQKS